MIHQAVCVYTKSNCQPCRRTKKELDLRGVTYTEVNIESDPGALAFVTELGHKAAPVVVLEDGTSWSGLVPALINQHFGKRPANV